MSRYPSLLLCLCTLASAACRNQSPAVNPPGAQEKTVTEQSFRKEIPRPGPSAPLRYPAPDRAQLSNGLELLSVRRPAGVVTLRLVVKHGASSILPGKSGLAALTARMLTEGTRTHSSHELAEAAEDLGSVLEHDVGRDYSMIGLTLLKEDIARGLALLAEVVASPAFAPPELTRVRDEWLEHLTAERQDPQRLASLAGLRALLGPDHGAPVHGGVTDVKALTAQDLVEFHRLAYTPGNAALVIAGDVDPAEVRALAEQSLGAWAGPAWTPTVPPLRPPQSPAVRVLIVDRPDAVQTAVFATKPLPTRQQPGYETRQVLNTLMGGLFTSRINQNLREAHAYTYGASSAAIATRHWGAWVVTTLVETDKTAPALRELKKEIDLARSPSNGQPIVAEEVERAKAALTSRRGAKLETTDLIASDTSELFFAGLPTEYNASYAQLISRVTLSDVQQEATRALIPEQMLIVLVGDRSLIEPTLKADGLSAEIAAASLVD